MDALSFNPNFHRFKTGCFAMLTLAFTRKFIIVASIVCYSTFAMAGIRLPAIIADNMVLQQNSRVALWGWAGAGEKVTITASWNRTPVTAVANDKGKWMAWLKTTKAGGPYTVTFRASDTVTINNVLLGEVWIASGQSNMEFFVGKTSNASYAGVIDYTEEIKTADYPSIRMIDVGNKVADEPQENFAGKWKICSPQTADTFSGVAYYFAREIHQATSFPIGIINATWGGTPAESWTKKEILENDPDFKVILDRYQKQCEDYPAAMEKFRAAQSTWRADTSKSKGAAPAQPMGPNSNKSPYKLYNGMIAPLLPFTVKGVIWYQGENNADRAFQYRRLFPAMIDNWRKDFDNPNMPFYFVQISPHRSQNPEIRDAQLYTYRHVPHTGMAVTTDNGDSLNIHPRNKKLVGERLARWPLYFEYGNRKMVFSGPLYKSSKVAGNKIIVQFDYTGSGLVAKDGDLKEFVIAAQDSNFVPAKAVIEGNTVVVWSEQVVNPSAVRFAWKNVPSPNLYNKEGLPASPFRTDTRKLTTEGKN